MIPTFTAQPLGVGLRTVKGWGCDPDIYSSLSVGLRAIKGWGCNPDIYSSAS